MTKTWSLLALALAGCVEQLPIEGAPCPCAVGWRCCEDEGLCVREGLLCPSVTPPAADAGTRVDGGISPLPDAGTPPPSDERGVVPPVPGGYRNAIAAGVAFDGQFTLVAFTHSPAAQLPCVNCGAPRLRGVFLDASGEEVDPYGFPIAEDLPQWGTLRAEPLAGRFLVGWWTPDAFALAVVRGGDGAVVARLAPREPADQSFDIASGGAGAVVVWLREGQMVAAAIDGQAEGSLGLEPEVVLCNSACTTPRVVHQADGRFIAGWAEADGFHAQELTLSAAGALAAGWEQVVAPASDLGPDRALALGASDGAVLCVWDRDKTMTEPAMLRARRLSPLDGAPLGEIAPITTTTVTLLVRHPRVVRAGADFAVLHNFAASGAGAVGVVRVRASDGAVLDPRPVHVSALAVAWSSPDIAGIDAAWTGTGLDLVWVDSRRSARRARLAPAASTIAAENIGRTPLPQAYPSAAALGSTVLAAFDGLERLPDGSYRRTLQAVRLRADGTALDAQAIHVADAAMGSWGGFSTVVPGAESFLVSWWDSGFTRGPHAVRAARVSPSGRVLDEIVLDEESDDGTRLDYIANGGSVAGFDGARFLVGWAREHRPATSGAVLREGLLVTIDPATGAVTGPMSLGESVVSAIAGAGGRAYLATNTPNAAYEHRIRVVEAGRVVDGPLLCRAPRYCYLREMATSGRELVGLQWQAVGTASSAIELVQIDAGTATVTARLLLPEVASRDVGRTDVSLAWDGEAYTVLLRDELAVATLARVEVPAGGTLRRASVRRLGDAAWGRTSLVPTTPGVAVAVYDAIDRRLDWRRIMARTLALHE